MADGSDELQTDAEVGESDRELTEDELERARRIAAPFVAQLWLQ